MNKPRQGVWIFTFILAVNLAASADPFMNLDFEAADLVSPPIIIGPDGGESGLVANWLPAWRIFRGGFEQTSGTIPLNFGISGDTYSLYDENIGPYGVQFEGELAFLAGRPSVDSFAVSLVQVGLIPADAMSLHYKAQKGPWDVQVNGVRLDLHGWNASDTGSTLQDVSVDVSAYAGQEVELKLTQALPSQWNALDSIRFSAVPVVPEPGMFWIAWVGWLGIWTGSSLRGPSRSRRTPG